MIAQQLKNEKDRGIVYDDRVLIGNWLEASKLAEHKLHIFLEQMKNGDLMLARYRKAKENLMAPADLSFATDTIEFGHKIVLRAPYVPSTNPPVPGEIGLLLGGRIRSNEIPYSQDLEDGCQLAGIPSKIPIKRALFTLMSVDYCDRNGEVVKYNQEFMLALSSSVGRDKPLYIRYDPNPVPGIYGSFPLYLSQNPVSNARWRFLPKQRPDITRFEQEGKPVKVNEDIIVNHVATNTNLGIDTTTWAIGLFAKICAPLMKTCLDIYGRELPNNIWQIYIPILDESVEKSVNESSIVPTKQ